MTASTGKIGHLVKFETASDGSPTNWRAIANITSISFTGRSVEEIDFTHLGSDGGFRELRSGLKDPGSINIEFHLNPDDVDHKKFFTRFVSGEEFPLRINYAAAGFAWAEVGRGYVSNPGDINISSQDPISGTATVRVTGAMTWTAIP